MKTKNSAIESFKEIYAKNRANKTDQYSDRRRNIERPIIDFIKEIRRNERAAIQPEQVSKTVLLPRNCLHRDQ